MKYEIVDCTTAHLRAIAPILRTHDRAEIEATEPRVRHVLHALWRSSFVSHAALVDGQIAAVWGFCGQFVEPEVEAWMFTAPAVERVPVVFAREVSAGIRAMLETRQSVISECMADYGAALKFFDLLGFEIGPLERRGARWFRTLKASRVPRPQSSPKVRHDERPFIIYALGRSRTAWLSAFLTYRDWTCFHERGLFMQNLSEMREFLGRRRTGTAETAGAPAWHLIRHFAPDIRAVVIRRDVRIAVDAMAEAYETIEAPCDRARLAKVFERENRDLDAIAALPGTLSVDFESLATARGCRRLFEFCLPFEFDWNWWLSLKDTRIEASLPEILAYYRTNQSRVEGFKRSMRGELVRLARAGAI